MQLAYLPTYFNKVNAKRYEYFAERFGFGLISSLHSLKLASNGEHVSLIVPDCIGIKKLCFLLVRARKVHSVTIWSLELYFVSYVAMLSEEKNLWRKYRNKRQSIFRTMIDWTLHASRRLAQVTLHRLLILSSKRITIIAASSLRSDFLRSRLKAKVLPLRNAPVWSQSSCPKEVIKLAKPYIYLGGSLNNLDDAALILRECVAKNLYFVISTSDSDSAEFLSALAPCHVILTGLINHEEVMRWVRGAAAVAVLYVNATWNQRLSASSKLLEAMNMGKTIIVSRNPGALDEISYFSYSRFVIVDMLGSPGVDIAALSSRSLVNASPCIGSISFEREC